MQGDYTRDTYRPNRQYTQVRQQQGRVQLDADWNEAFDIVAARARTTRADVIGPCGAPEDAAGFGITPDGANLRIGAGRYYVHGALCENPQTVAFTEQAMLPGVTLPTDRRRYLAFLDTWERHITALEDPEIREVALGGPDTATRLQLIAQVKLVAVADNATCDDFDASWRPNEATSTGRLAARAQPAPEADQPCLIPPGAGYRRLENQLYRVEIHAGGDIDTATFKWSRENGSVVTGWTDQDGDVLMIAGEGRDENLGFGAGDWIELTDDGRELRGEPGILVQLLDVQGLELIIDKNTILDPDDPAATSVDRTTFGLTPKVRRWDSPGAVTVEIAGDNEGFLPLEEGVEVRFSPAPSRFRTGDYWLIPARTNLGDVLWPTDAGSGEAVAQPPHGIGHRYCPLALVDQRGNGWTLVADCRCLFPPLCNIHAHHVQYDNSNCRPELAAAETVQEALDILCRTTGGRCTFHVSPGMDLQAVFDAIPSGGDAQICFATGTYELSATALAEGKGHLLLSGSGYGTQLVVREAESALTFTRCAGVTVEKMAAASRLSKPLVGNSLSGVLTFIECGDVTVDHVRLQCGAGFVRAASCLRVFNGPKFAAQSTVRVRHCRLAVGHLQTGVLLTNVGRAQVEDNFLRAAQRDANVSFERVIENRAARARLRRLLVANPQRAARDTRLREGEVIVNVRGTPLRFTTAPALADARLWQTLVDAEMRRGEAARRSTPESILRRTADRVLLERGSATTSRRIAGWLSAVQRDDQAVAGQGIVIGGSEATDLRVLNNTVNETLQGIHIGVSHRETQRGAPDLAVTVLVQGNTVGVSLPSGATQERHGIFIGNCTSLVVQDNYLTRQGFSSTTRLTVEAIRLFGHLGKRAILRQNHAEGFTVGIRINPLNASKDPPTPLWLVADNVATVSVTNDNAPVSLAEQQGRVRQSQNFA